MADRAMMPIAKDIKIEMNNRDYKQFAPLSIHHIYNRGVGKMNIFVNTEDYRFFLKRLREGIYPEEDFSHTMMPIAQQGRRSKLPAGSFDLLGYCLMPNHFHLIMQQNGDLPVSSLMSKLCTSYSKYFNRKYDRVGSVFQDQFKAVLVASDAQLRWLLAYVHLNPLKAGLVNDLKMYPYSSYPDYLGERDGSLCRKDIFLENLSSQCPYSEEILGFEDNLISNELKID